MTDRVFVPVFPNIESLQQVLGDLRKEETGFKEKDFQGISQSVVSKLIGNGIRKKPRNVKYQQITAIALSILNHALKQRGIESELVYGVVVEAGKITEVLWKRAAYEHSSELFRPTKHPPR